MKKLHFLTLLLLFLAFTSCDPNDNDNNNNNNNDNFQENFGSEVSRDFMGRVVDINGDALQGVNIKIGTSTATTDANGVFMIDGANVYQRFAYITATKAGFIDGSRAMVPTSGRNQVRIMMIPSTPIATIASGASSEVSLPSGTKVVFDGAFEDENGNAYSGNVAVSMFHLLPSNANLSELMPGMLYAADQDNNERILQTFGMMNVELRGSGGQKLQIAQGHTAEIEMLIDPSQMASSPSTIPLWHFDEQSGYWKEDGMATKTGNKYVGEVSHFSWWNCDAPFPTVSLTVHLMDTNGNPLSNMIVQLTSYTMNGLSGWTNLDGFVSGMVPSNVTLTLNVLGTGVCSGTILHTMQIGPFSANTTLPDIVVSPSGPVFSTTISGTLVQCDNSGVTNGYVSLISGADFQVAEVTNGSFSFSALSCSPNATFTLQGVDFENLQVTDSISYQYDSPEVFVGNLPACTAVDEYQLST
ncbi:MAG TPA: carboxypeptidase-like regulatory domain-containing protein [Flavobacterium sp.]|jgi:hypothetical protein